MLLGAHGNRSPLGSATVLLEVTGLAILDREFDLDDLVIVPIDCWRPTQTLSSSWTPRFMRLPINQEAARVEALLGFGLPLVISSRWGNQINVVLLAALDELLRLGIIGIGQVLPGQQVLLLQGCMNHWRHIHIAEALSTWVIRRGSSSSQLSVR